MAPISKKVIALLTAMLEHMQANPDDTEETEALIKATLQAIAGTKRSSIRRVGDAFLDFADERPTVALACVLFIISLNPVGLVTTIAEQYGWIQPRKVQIEVKEPQTGSYKPANIDMLENLASKQHITQGDINVGLGQQIANVTSPEWDAASSPTLEYTTEGGTVVSVRSAGNSGTAKAKLRWPGRESRRSNGSPAGRTSGGQVLTEGVDRVPLRRYDHGVVY